MCNKPIFKTYLIADVSTEYLTPKDCELLSGCPELHIAKHDEDYGDFFYIPDKSAASPEELETDYLQPLREYGMSKYFLYIIRALYEQGIPYLRFDCDGAHIDGLPVYSLTEDSCSAS